MVLKAILEKSLQEAVNEPAAGDTPQIVNRNRSEEWVESLARSLREYYEFDPSVRVFSKHFEGYRNEFQLNELLYDIHVCRVSTVMSARQGKILEYVTDALWQIESELAKNTRDAIIDFSKLVVGNGKNKLFIGPRTSDNTAFINTLLPAAGCCNGNVFVALISHPNSWGEARPKMDLWKLNIMGVWESI
ncbi:hypothetical protein QUF72_19730 [Desulfobacterales bacterium HSG2]|nr:hypothetical protein [Desulfobacterales bacterium HSG2]